MDRFARSFGAKVKQMRVGRGMTQAQLAGAASLGANYVPRIERGEMTPSLGAAHRIAQALGTTLDDLCGAVGKRDVVDEALRSLVALSDADLAAFKRAVRAVEDLRSKLRTPRPVTAEGAAAETGKRRREPAKARSDRPG